MLMNGGYSKNSMRLPYDKKISLAIAEIRDVLSLSTRQISSDIDARSAIVLQAKLERKRSRQISKLRHDEISSESSLSNLAGIYSEVYLSFERPTTFQNPCTGSRLEITSAVQSMALRELR